MTPYRRCVARSLHDIFSPLTTKCITAQVNKNLHFYERKYGPINTKCQCLREEKIMGKLALCTSPLLQSLLQKSQCFCVDCTSSRVQEVVLYLISEFFFVCPCRCFCNCILIHVDIFMESFAGSEPVIRDRFLKENN